MIDNASSNKPIDPEFIVKIQRPIVTNEPVAQALIYNQDRSIHTFAPLTQVESYFEDEELKVYCWAHYDEGDLNIHERVEDEDIPTW